MNKKEIMNSELGSTVMYGIEKRIHQLDSELKERGIILNDSNVKSALAKAEKLAKGKSLLAKPKDKKEEAIFLIAEEINKLKFELVHKIGSDDNSSGRFKADASFWINVLDAVKDSLNLRITPGERNYLDYLEGFMAKAQSKSVSR